MEGMQATNGEVTVKTYDVQSVELAVAPDRVFEFIADPQRLPGWTRAFAEVRGRRALLRTGTGEIEIELRVEADTAARTIDWYMTFPDGALATAFSRVVPLGEDRSVYSFVLTPPPAPLEAVEGALAEQSRTLAEELATLKRLLEHDGRG